MVILTLTWTIWGTLRLQTVCVLRGVEGDSNVVYQRTS